MVGKVTVEMPFKPSACALAMKGLGREAVAADHGVTAQQLAGVALQAALEAVGKKAHSGQRRNCEAYQPR